MVYDFKLNGNRVVRKRDLGRWRVWIEESAPYHVYRSAKYGLELWRHDEGGGGITITLELGRYAVHAANSPA